jgi:hypothetical protein
MDRRADSRLLEALAERDRALTDLAKERALTNALKLKLEHVGEPSVPLYPPSAGYGPTPLRYRVADRANEVAKVVLGPVHRLAKRLLGAGDR